MKKWLRRMRGAIGIGVTWAFGWAIAGVLIGVASLLLPGLPSGAFFEVFDAPVPALAIPGFFAGVFFSMVLGIAGRDRSFRELSLARFAGWGAVGGLLLTLFPFALVAVGLASREGSDVGTSQIIAAIAAPFILLGAASAAVTLIVARIAEGRASGDPAEDSTGEELADAETQALLGAGSASQHGHRVARTREAVRSDPEDHTHDG